jgi:hypothetical protein
MYVFLLAGQSTNHPASKRWILTSVLDLHWFEIIGTLWGLGRKIVRGLSNEGVYEVLDYECEVEIINNEGTKAKIRKREKVKYLQDHINSFLDEAWGDGDFLINYKCSPGFPADEYRHGHNTYKLISLREFRNKGDIDEFNIQWEMKNGFLDSNGSWGTAINQRTKRIKIVIVFPADRPPLRVSLFEKNYQRTQILAKDAVKKFPDGRWAITWEKDDPRLYENYVLSWDW